jgi:hypothetical protein
MPIERTIEARPKAVTHPLSQFMIEHEHATLRLETRKIVTSHLITKLKDVLDTYWSDLWDPDFLINGKHQWKPKDFLSLARRRRYLTQKELAARAGMAASEVSKFESGRQPIGKIAAQKLAQALGIDFRELL